MIVDTVVDVGLVFYDIYRIGADNIFGDNCPGTLQTNAAALGLDVAAIFVPGVTGLNTEALNKMQLRHDRLYPDTLGC